MTFHINISPVLEQNIQIICIFHNWMMEFLMGLDNSLLTGMILIDLQKTFDTIDHNTLLEKLMPIGFCDDTVD